MQMGATHNNNKKTKAKTSISKDVEKLELSCIAGEKMV